MMRNILLLSVLAGAFGALELNSKTFDAEVKTSGKNAFVKFLAPW